MGVLSDLFGQSKSQEAVVDVAASLAPFYVNQTALNIAGGTISVPRASALSVPAVARANGIITSVVGSLPIEKFNDASGERIPVERSFKQPDPRVPASLIYSYLAQDLWLFGVAYGQVMDMYAASDGGRVRRWTRIDPTWVSVRTNPLGTEVIGYTVNGQDVPMTGVGSIIAFYNLADAGLLNRAGRTVRAAIELEKAAETPIRALDVTGKFAAQASQANQARTNILDRMAKDKEALTSAIAKRDEVADPIREAAFAKSTITPEELQSQVGDTVGNTIKGILASGPGARKPVKDAMAFASERLKDGTDPERLYSVRKDLRDAAQGLLNKEGSAYNLAKKELETVIRSVDDVLESSAPGYKEYLSKYAASSRGIERLEAVQDFRKRVLSTTPDIGRVGDFLISQPAFTRAIRSLEDDPKLGGLSRTQFSVLQRVGKDLDDGVRTDVISCEPKLNDHTHFNHFNIIVTLR